LVNVTAHPATEAPVSSETTPEIFPCTFWPKRAAGVIAQRRTATKKLPDLRMFIGPLLFFV
jgi:hypothetical protein